MTEKQSRAKKRYHDRKARRVCVECEAGLLDDDPCVRCIECRDARLADQTKYLRSDKGREKARLAKARMRANGDHCKRCGKSVDGVAVCETCRHHTKLVKAGVIPMRTRMPCLRAISAETTTYQPVDELANQTRVHVLSALYRLTHDGEWADSREIFLAARFDDDGRSSERNTAAVTLGRLVMFGLAERRGDRCAFEYRVTATGRAEVARYRRGEFPALNGRWAA